MKVLQQYRRLAWLAGCVTVTLGPASLAAPAAAPAQARVAATPVVSHLVASWGDNTVGQLGDGTTVLRTLFHDIAAGSDVVQVAGGGSMAWPCGPTARSRPGGSTNTASWATAPPPTGSRRSG
jgi:hypothetical protein